MASDARRRALVCDLRVKRNCLRCHVWRAHKTRGSEGVTRTTLDEGGVTSALVETVTGRDLAELDVTLTDNRR